MDPSRTHADEVPASHDDSGERTDSGDVCLKYEIPELESIADSFPAKRPRTAAANDTCASETRGAAIDYAAAFESVISSNVASDAACAGSAGSFASTVGDSAAPVTTSNCDAAYLYPSAATVAESSLTVGGEMAAGDVMGGGVAHAIGQRPMTLADQPGVASTMYDTALAYGNGLNLPMMSNYNSMLSAMNYYNSAMPMTSPMFWQDSAALGRGNCGEYKTEEKSSDLLAARSPSTSQGILDVDAIIDGDHDISSDSSRKRKRRESTDTDSFVPDTGTVSSIGGACASNVGGSYAWNAYQNTACAPAAAVAGAGTSPLAGFPGSSAAFAPFYAGSAGYSPFGFSTGMLTAPLSVSNPPSMVSAVGNPAGTADLSGFGAPAPGTAKVATAMYDCVNEYEASGEAGAMESASTQRGRRRKRGGTLAKKKRRGGKRGRCSSRGEGCTEEGADDGEGGSVEEPPGVHSPFPNSYVDASKESEFVRQNRVVFQQYCHARNSLYHQYMTKKRAMSTAMHLNGEDRERLLLQFEMEAKIQERSYFNHFMALSMNQQSPLMVDPAQAQAAGAAAGTSSLGGSSSAAAGSAAGSTAEMSGVTASTLAKIKACERSKRQRNGKKRTKKPKFSEYDVRVFTDWYNAHLDNPYPSKQEKEMMARLTGLTKYQVSRWFCNARTRKPHSQRSESAESHSEASQAFAAQSLLQQYQARPL